MRSSQHQPHHSVRSPELSGTIRRPSSNDRVVARSFAGTLGASEFPIVDAQARYSISYVPGMSEHMVNTGKTLPEAQLKVVLFACEVERLNTLNYNLVKENEILKAQNTKSNREEDLETKLAIVLAENEKLNQIVEELQAVYSRERESLANEDYERRIAELLHEAEDWKNRYKKLEVSGPPSGGDKHALEDLQRERDHLREQLGRQGRDLDALRARLESFQVGGPADVRLLQEQITNLKVENEKQKSELHAMKLKYGNADALQQSLHQYESRVRVLLDENDKLNRLLTEKTREMQASQNAREISIAQRPQEHVVRAVAGSPTQGHHEIVDKLTHENHDLKEKAARLAAENERLNGLVLELRNEAEHLRRQHSEGQGVGNRRADQLTVQINTLLEENKRLNSLLEAKAREEDFRTKSAQLISENDRLNKLVIDLRAENDHLNKRLSESGKNAHLSASITSLQTENSHLNGLLKQRIDEIEGLKHRNRELELGAGSVADLKNKVGALVTENDRLNRLATDLSADNERLKRSNANANRINELTVQVNNLLAENTRLNDLLVARVREIETLRQENDRLKHQIHDLEGSGARITQLTLQINNLLDENKKLNHLLLERGDTEVLRRRVTELEASIATLRTENERLVRQVSEHGHGKERIELLTQQINSLLAENQRLNTLLLEKSGHSGKVTELTNQVNGLIAENRRLNEIITQRTTETDSLRRRITELENSSTIVTELRSKLSLTASENERLNHLVADHRAEIDKLRLQVAESSRSSHLSGQLNSLLSENTRLNELLIQKSNEVETLRRKGIEADELRSRVSTITSENERLKITINEQRAELDRLRAQSHDTGRVHELSAHVSGLHDENRKLSSLAQDRANEVDALKKKVQDAQAGSHQLNHLTEENRRLNTLLLEKSSELDRLKYQSADTSKIQELNIQITRLQDENRRQNTIILERTTELDTLRRRLVEAEAHGGKARIDQLTVQINTLLTENSRLNDSLTNRIREVEELKARSSTTNIVSVSSGDINNLRATLVILAAENERLNAAVEQNKTRVSSTSVDDSSSLRISVQHLTSELDESRRKLIEAQVAARESEDLKKKIQILTLDSQSFQGILKDKTTEIDSLRTKVYTLEAASRETETLKLRIAQLEGGHHGDAEGARSAFVLLSAENDRLKAELAKAGEHHHHHHHEPVQTNLHISGDIGTVEVLAADNDRIGRELEIVRRTLHDKETEIESLKKRLTVDQSAELRNRVESLLNENEKLNNYLVERQREIESLRHRLGEQPAEGHLHVDIHDVHHHDEGAKKSALPHGDVVIHHHDVEAIEDVIRLRTIITEQTRQLETLSKRIQEADFLKQENERITRLLSEKLKEVDELKRSPTPSTAVTTVAGTERSEEVELLKKRIAELEAHEAKHHHHTGIFAAVKEKILEKLGAGHEHEHEQGDLEGEYARLLDAQITEVNERFEQERQQFKRTEENLNIKIQQLEESVTLITSEKDKLSAAQEKSKQEIDNWKRRYEHFESQKEMEMDALKLDLEKKYRESPSRKGIPEQVIDLEDRVTYLNNEIERLQDHLNMTLTELEEWRKRYSELEVLRAQEIDELRQQFDNSKKSSIEAKEIQIKFNAERTAYEAQILQLQQKVGDVQHEIKTLTAENERLEKLSITRLEEVEEVRRSHGGSTSITSTQTLEITQLKTQIESYKAASHNVKQLAIKYSAEKAADLSQIRQLKQINENYKSELEKLYELLDERKADFESLTKQNEDLLKMYEKIVSTSSTEKVDIRASQDRTSFTPKELTEMETTKEQYMKNSIELTRKNKELVDKLQELDILKMKYEEALANYQALNARLFEKLNAER